MNTEDEVAGTSLEVVKIFKEFYLGDNMNISIVKAIKSVCDLFEINNAVLIIRNDIQKEFIQIFDYKLGDEKEVSSNKFDNINKYSNFNMDSNKFLDVAEYDFIKLFNEKSYYYTNKIDKQMANIFKAVNYDISGDNMSEVLVHHTKIEDYFAFAVFEKSKGSTKFSQYQKDILVTLCNMIQNVMHRTELTKLLYNERKVKDAIINNENMPICMVEKESNKIIDFNELYKQITPDIELNHSFNDLTYKSNKDSDCTADCRQLERNAKDNSKYWIKKSVPFKLGNGMDVYLMYAKDIDDYVEQLEVIDLLTYSLSVKGLTEYYEREIKTNNKTYMLLSLDIDKFKHINNEWSMTLGDAILKQMALVFRKTIEDEEMFCRIGEDRFAIILKFDNIEDINVKFENIKTNLYNMQKKEFPDFHIKFSGGVTIINKELDFNVLIDQANIARTSIKGSVSDKFAVYTAEVEKKVQKELLIEQRMDIAVENDEFIPYLQPKFELGTMKIYGAEALVRWITPTDIIYPDKFIPIFEKNGFITKLDFVIYRKIIKHIRECLDRNMPVYPISMNVSRNHIKNKNFADDFMAIVKEYNVPADLLELEITESAFIEEKDVLKTFVDKIKDINVKVSIDDFGSAYSSLQILKDVNMDILKIDKGFLDNIGVTDEFKFTKDVFVLKNIMNLAKDLDCKIICEGVETDKQIEILKNINCELGQGYVFAKPMPIIEYEKRFLL